MWVVVRSFSPLELYVHKYCYARIASTDFDMNETGLMDWTKHFGLSDRDEGHYNVGPRYEQVKEAFDNIEEDGWEKMRVKMHGVIKDLFKAAVLYKPEIHSENSRAYYGIDIIIDQELTPHVLEVTFSPELSTVSGIIPSFMSEMFRCMFLREEEGMFKLF